jgi:hypothetical protein
MGDVDATVLDQERDQMLRARTNDIPLSVSILGADVGRRMTNQPDGVAHCASILLVLYNKSNCSLGLRKAPVESFGRSPRPERRQLTSNIVAICWAKIPSPVWRFRQRES